MVLPLFANTQLSGFIGLDNPDLVNPGVSISLLSNAGGHLASTLNNLRMFRMLEEKQKTLESNLEELQKEKHILEALCVDYTSFYYVIWQMILWKRSNRAYFPMVQRLMR